MRVRHPQRRQLVASWDTWTQEHAAVIAPVRVVVLLTLALLVFWLAAPRHGLWPHGGGPTALALLASSGAEAMRCTVSKGPKGRMCMAGYVQHTAASTQLLRNKTGNAMALQLTIAAASADFGTAALTFYDSPVVVDPAPALNSTCEERRCTRPSAQSVRCIDVGAEGSPAKQAANEAGGTQDITPGGGVPTVFMARDQPSPHHLVRVQLLPLFLALQSFKLEGGRFQIVFVDSRPHDWSTPVFDEAAGLPSRLLSELPACFRAASAVFGVLYDNIPLSAHAATTARETAAARPVVTAFSRWLLQRFGVAQQPANSPAAGSGDGEGAAEAAPWAAVLDAFVQSGAENVCRRPGAAEGALRPLLTVVVRTDKLNGQGRRLTGTKHVVEAAEACGFRTSLVDLAGMPFGSQLQIVANSSVYIAVHGAAEVLLLALPPQAVAVQLMPYKFDDSHLYYHTFANWAAAAARTMLVWHNTNVWHTSPGRARVDDYKNHDTRMPQGQAAAVVAAAAMALQVPLSRRTLGAPLLLNQAVPRCRFDSVPGAQGGC